MMRRVSIVAALAVLAGPAHADGQRLPTRPIEDVVRFTAPDADTRVTITALGDSCDEARISLVVESADGEVLHTQSHPLHQLNVDGAGCETLVRTMSDMIREQTAADLPSDAAIADGDRSGYHDVDIPAVHEARRSDRSVLCLRAGKSYFDCFVYRDGKAVRLFSSGS